MLPRINRRPDEIDYFLTLYYLLTYLLTYFFALQNGVSPNFQFEDNLGPLHLAAKNGNTQCAFYLLQFNANPNMISKVRLSSAVSVSSIVLFVWQDSNVAHKQVGRSFAKSLEKLE